MITGYGKATYSFALRNFDPKIYPGPVEFMMLDGSTIRFIEKAIEDEKRLAEIFSPEGLSKLFGLPPLPAVKKK